MEFLKGKKTYIIVGLFVALFVVQSFVLSDGQVVPEWVFGLLSGVGLAAIRAAFQDVSGNKGWKTYLAAFVVAGVSVANGLGLTLPLDAIYGICSVLGVVGVRDAIKKLKV